MSRETNNYDYWDFTKESLHDYLAKFWFGARKSYEDEENDENDKEITMHWTKLLKTRCRKQQINITSKSNTKFSLKMPLLMPLRSLKPKERVNKRWKMRLQKPVSALFTLDLDLGHRSLQLSRQLFTDALFEKYKVHCWIKLLQLVSMGKNKPWT